MRAAVLHEHRRPFAIEELDLAPPGPAEVEVRLQASGVSPVTVLQSLLHTPLAWRRTSTSRRPVRRRSSSSIANGLRLSLIHI